MIASTKTRVLFTLLGSSLLCKAQTLNQCTLVTLARPGQGVSYQGRMRSDDYGFTLVIPPKLSGWGAGAGAPFHGFTIFLPDKRALGACLGFTIQLRVALPEDIMQPRNTGKGREVGVGNIRGWRYEQTGALEGFAFKNVTVAFSVARGVEVYDGEVLLVTPLESVEKNEAILSSFLSQMHFDGTNTIRAR